MKNTVRNFLYVSLLMLLPLWTACDKDVHENESHGLAVGMEWLDGIEPTDITSPVNLCARVFLSARTGIRPVQPAGGRLYACRRLRPDRAVPV